MRSPDSRNRGRRIVIAPLFDAAGFPDYQRLGRRGLGSRADLALIALVDDVLSSRGLQSRKLHLFGHSGGAQFTHRFVIAHSRARRPLRDQRSGVVYISG